MSRPTKQGIDYFPLDCRFDDKIEMFLIEKEAVGLGVLVTIWQMIYVNEGYYIANNEDLHLLIKRKIGVGINEVSDIINACFRRNIFDEEMHKKHGIITSKAIQKRYFDAAKKKKCIDVCVDYIIKGVSARDNWVNVAGNATKVKVKVKVKEKAKSAKTTSDQSHVKSDKFNQDDVNLANGIFDLILAMNPKHKKPDLSKWADTIRLMRERDKRTHHEIASLFQWANGHDFWKTNILSPTKLREQWDKLVIQRDNPGPGGRETFDELQARRRREQQATIGGEYE